MADQKGLMLIEESALYARPWTMTNQSIVIENMRRQWIPEWIRAHRNHPSIVLWSAENEDYKCVGGFTPEQLQSLSEAIQVQDPTRPVIHDGDEDLNGLARTFNWHYPEGYEKLPRGSIYSWASKVHPNKPTGIGEFMACPWVEAIKPDVFWWHGLWSRGCRYVGFTDIRPFVMTWAWDHQQPEARENLRRSFSPLALFDKDYDDLGIAPLATTNVPSLLAGSQVERTLVLYNDDYHGTRLAAEVQLASGGKVLASIRKNFELAVGEHRDIPLRFNVPNAREPLDLTLAVRKNGGIRFQETKRFNINGAGANAKSKKSGLKLGELQPWGVSEPRLTQVHPQEIDGPLANPYCGWGLWAGSRFFDSRRFSHDYNTTGFGDDAPLFSWVLVDWMWADLEPREGEFHWEELDRIIEFWRCRGKQFLVRLWVTSDPGWAGAPGNQACPDWLWAAGVQYQEYRGEGNVIQRQPDYCAASYEEKYLPRLKKLLTAYRDRYCGPGSPIIMNQVMGVGDWGEWHTMWSHYPWTSGGKKREVLSRIIQIYFDLFAGGRPPGQPATQLSIAQVYDDDCDGNTPLNDAVRHQALDVALAKGLTFSRHGFIDGMSGWPNDFIMKYWQQNPMIAEANWSYEQVKHDNNHGTMPEFIDAFLKFHSTYAHLYLHSSSYRKAMADDRDQFERALKPGGLGYRFVLTSAAWESDRRPGQMLTLRQEWANRNESWCSQPYRLKLYLLNDAGQEVWSDLDHLFDLRPCLRGANYSVTSKFVLPGKLPPGNYELRIALVDDAGTPSVQLAIAGVDGAKRYRLGSLKILPGSGVNSHSNHAGEAKAKMRP